MARRHLSSGSIPIPLGHVTPDNSPPLHYPPLLPHHHGTVPPCALHPTSVPLTFSSGITYLPYGPGKSGCLVSGCLPGSPHDCQSRSALSNLRYFKRSVRPHYYIQTCQYPSLDGPKSVVQPKHTVDVIFHPCSPNTSFSSGLQFHYLQG